MPTFVPCQPCKGRRPTVAAGHPMVLLPAGRQDVLALQQSHGNRAVSRTIIRQQRTLARSPRRRGGQIDEPGNGWDGLQGGDALPRNLTDEMKSEVRRFRGDLEQSMKANDQSKWGRWAAEDAAAFQGTAAQRATLYAEFQRQMIQVDGSWVAKFVRGADGSYVFLSSQIMKRALVVAPDGTFHAGKWDALTETPDGQLTVDYGKLYKVTPRGPTTPPVGGSQGSSGGGSAPADGTPTTAPSKTAKPQPTQGSTVEPPTGKPPTSTVEPPTTTVEPPTVKPSTTPVTPTTTGQTIAADQVTDDFVRRLATEQEAMIMRTGRYVLLGRTLYAVMIIGGVAFLVYDIVERGPIYAIRDFGIATALTEFISARAGIGLGLAGITLALVFLPSDQAGESERQAKAALIDDLVESAFPGTLGGKVFVCYSDRCTGSHREILDHDTYNKVWPQVAAALEHPFELDDSPRAKAVLAEHKQDAERDKARAAEHDREMASIREAMSPSVGFYVKSSVGESGQNDPEDLKKTARRLKELGFLEKDTTDPDEIAEAIYFYQGAVLGWSKPDGRLDPRGETARALRAGRRRSMALR